MTLVALSYKKCKRNSLFLCFFFLSLFKSNKSDKVSSKIEDKIKIFEWSFFFLKKEINIKSGMSMHLYTV